MKYLPPIRLRRLYTNPEGRGEYTIVADPLPTSITSQMTEAQQMARRDEEKKAIEAEYARRKPGKN